MIRCSAEGYTGDPNLHASAVVTLLTHSLGVMYFAYKLDDRTHSLSFTHNPYGIYIVLAMHIIVLQLLLLSLHKVMHGIIDYKIQ